MLRHYVFAGLMGFLLSVAGSRTGSGQQPPGEGLGVPGKWISQHLDSEYDALAWGCRLKHCSHVYYESIQGWKDNPVANDMVTRFTAWFDRDGKRILADWRAGTVQPEDRQYLPLVKTVFWDTTAMTPAERRGLKLGTYFRFNRFPEPASPEDEEYQAVLEKGLAVLHKIYNRRPLTPEDRSDFHEWLLAYYCNYYIGGVDPASLPADSWKTFARNMLGSTQRTGKRFRGLYSPGDEVYNFRIIDSESIWGMPSFDLNGDVTDNCWHLKPERLDDIIATYRAFAEEYYEPADEYPIVKPRDWPSDTRDTERDSTFHNYLARQRKPVILGKWFANRDEANCRMVLFMYLHYRAFGDKLNFLFPEPGYQSLVEKNHLIFTMDDQMRARMILWNSVPYVPFLPEVSIGNVAPLGGKLNRVYLVNQDGAFLCDLDYDGNGQPREGDSWDMLLTEMLGFDANLVNCFRTGFSPDSAPAIVPWGESVSQFGKGLELSSANGHNNKSYNRYSGLYDVIGELISVDADEHTITVLREEFDERDYPNYLTVKRFDLLPVLPHVKLFDRFKAEGNSREARTWVFKVNQGVFTFVNGREVRDESGFRKGDVVSVMTRDGMEYPYVIRAIRFNFAPTIDPVADVSLPVDSEPRTVKLTGIDDNNQVCEQSITVGARSLAPGVVAPPEVRYRAGSSSAELILAPVDGQTGAGEIEVQVKDSGGTYDGGQDTTVITFRVVVGRGQTETGS